MRANKNLGQHFLTDTQIAEREVNYADIQSNDTILEIGPGHGILTRLIAKQAQNVIAIEKDPRLVAELTPTLPSNVSLLQQDILETDFTQLPVFTKIVSNLPFNISSPLTFKILEHQFTQAILMYQKDFADRMAAKPGNSTYSRLTVHIYYKTQCKLLENVPRNAFTPTPKVDASIVELIPRQKPPFEVQDEKFFLRLTQLLFMHRRKKIKNTLTSYLKNIPADLPYKDDRVEVLSPKEIGYLSNILYNSDYKHTIDF